MKYYAIKDSTGKRCIVNEWSEAQEIIKGCSRPSYKAFKSEEEARAFLNGEVYTTSSNINGTVAYIDGSYDSSTGAYSFGGVLIHEGNVYKFKKAFPYDKYSVHRNVAGEIKGAGYIMQYCINNNIDTIHIFYDYIGIEKWFTGEWKANSEIAMAYLRFKDSIKGRLNVVFHKVMAHTNDHYNDMADRLAKEALGLR